MERQKKMKIIAYTFCAIAVVLIILVIVLPIVIKDNVKSKYTKKTKPKIDNTNLWAKFPGDIKTNTTHSFHILDYYENNNSKIKDSLILEEDILYENFNFSEKEEKITFDAKTQFKLLNQPKNESISILNLGMFEAIETFSNPTKYQEGINSLIFLLNKAFIKPDLFIRQLFAYDLYNDLIIYEDKVRTFILNNIEEEKADKILSDEEEYSQYSFKSILGFYEWVKILGISEDIEKAKWLSDLFGLTENEIDSIVGINSYLNNFYIDFNIVLANKFKCENNRFCGKEIFFSQIINGEVLNYIDFEGDLLSFYQFFEPNFYPFPKSPEMFEYFEEYKKKVNKADLKIEDYLPNLVQLKSLLNSSYCTCLLASNNSALFLSLNNSNAEDSKVFEIFKISKKVLNFFSDYIYNYLPNIFLYQEFNDDKGKIHKINNVSNAFSIITQKNLENTYKLLYEQDLYNLILSDIVWESLLNKFYLITYLYDIKNFEPDDICPLIMQQALDDGKKVLQICSDPKLAFNSAETIIKWFDPYYCVIYEDHKNCNMSIIEYLKTLVYITDDEIKAIYDKNYFGGILEEYDKLLKELYKCEDNICNNEYLAKIQFWKGELTKNLPSPYNKNTISKMFPDLFPFPVEMSYFAEQLGETDEILEEDINYLISLCPKSDNIFSKENINVFNKKINFEKDYTLFIEGGKDKNSKYKTINILNNGYLFTNNIKSSYKNLYNILEGNSDEDKRYIQYLSNGPFFQNFKPNFNKTTGFNFGIDFSNGKNISIDYDNYGIYGTTKKGLRKIITINDFPILNIKKLEYNYLLNDFSIINSPIMNFQTLTGDKSFIDGYQYEAKEKPIYYYDRISSRPFKFNYEDDSTYKDLDCKLYELDKDDLANNINEENDLKEKKAFLTQKLNKPFLINVGNKDLSIKVNDSISEKNYICVDPFTNMVIDSQINFVYSIYTKNYGYINPKIENNKTYPIFIYQRNYSVDADSYNDYFPKINNYKTFKLVFLIVGIILIVVCVIVSLWAFIKIHRSLVKEDLEKNNSSQAKERIINDSREATLMNRSSDA